MSFLIFVLIFGASIIFETLLAMLAYRWFSKK